MSGTFGDDSTSQYSVRQLYSLIKLNQEGMARERFAKEFKSEAIARYKVDPYVMAADDETKHR